MSRVLVRDLRRARDLRARAAPATRAFGLFDPEVRGILPELGMRRNASNEKARRLLGWAPKSPREAILATAQSLSELGLLSPG
jgi:nucleoside-diphosphate-sugar epimerase